MHARLLSTAALVLAPCAVAAQSLPALGAGRVAAQIATGTVATPIGFVGGGIATKRIARALGAREHVVERAAYTGAYTTAALAAAAGPALIGARGSGHGSYWAGVGGAVVGGLGSALVKRLHDRAPDDVPRPCHLACIVAATAIVALPSIGATVAYDASRR